MDLRNILDAPENKRRRKNKRKYYGVLFASFASLGIGYLLKNSEEVAWTSLVLLSGILFLLYLTLNFINWEDRKTYHYIQYLGNLSLTAGLMLKILAYPYDNMAIFTGIGLVFLSYLVSFFIND